MRKLLTTLILAIIVLTPGCVILTPIINVIEVVPNTIIAGESAELNWNVTGSSTVNINPGPGAVAVAGTIALNPIVTTVYTLTAQGPFGVTSRSVVLIVKPAPIAVNFNANPAFLQSGGDAALQWNVSGADSVQIDQGIGNVSANGMVSVSPEQTTTYTLTGRNASGVVTRTTTITVNPPMVASFSASPTTIYRGQSASLTWNVTGATKATIEPEIGEVPLAGSRTVSPNSTTSYTLIASTSCCVVTKAANVTVGTVYPYSVYGYPYDYYPYPLGYPYSYYSDQYYSSHPDLIPFIEIFSISPNHVSSGMPAILSWNVVGATSITITGIGNVPRSGTRIVSPVVTTTYILTASTAYGANTRQVTVQVP